MKLTLEWQEYDNDYQKKIQDIRTKDGKEYMTCWPNAGKWHVMGDHSEDEVPDELVTHVRLAHSEYN